MIDPVSGNIHLDSGDTLHAWMSESDFLKTQIGATARPGLRNAGYQWYELTTLIMSQPWSMSLAFANGALELVSFNPAKENRNWDSFSEKEEQRIAGDLQDMLRALFGGTTCQKQGPMENYSFPWGRVGAGVVPQNAIASIGVVYAVPVSPWT